MRKKEIRIIRKNTQDNGGAEVAHRRQQSRRFQVQGSKFKFCPQIRTDLKDFFERSMTDLDLCHLWHLGERQHKLALMCTNYQKFFTQTGRLIKKFKVMSLQSMIFVTTRPIKQACWRSLLQKFKVQTPHQLPRGGERLAEWDLQEAEYCLHSHTPTLLNSLKEVQR